MCRPTFLSSAPKTLDGTEFPVNFPSVWGRTRRRGHEAVLGHTGIMRSRRKTCTFDTPKCSFHSQCHAENIWHRLVIDSASSSMLTSLPGNDDSLQAAVQWNWGCMYAVSYYRAFAVPWLVEGQTPILSRGFLWYIVTGLAKNIGTNAAPPPPPKSRRFKNGESWGGGVGLEGGARDNPSAARHTLLCRH